MRFGYPGQDQPRKSQHPGNVTVITIDTDPMFTEAERKMFHVTMARAFRRAADILDKITQRDVEEAQVEISRQGVSLENLATIDRAALASAHFRSIAETQETQTNP